MQTPSSPPTSAHAAGRRCQALQRGSACCARFPARTYVPFFHRISFLLFVASFAGCRRSPPPAIGPVIAAPDAIVQWSGPRGGPETAGARTIRTAAEWAAFWKEIGREVPALWTDDGHMAVAIFLGQKRTAGYSVSILGSRVENGRFVVDYRETAPAPDTMVAQMLTSPWAIARLPRSELPVVTRSAGLAPTGPPPK